MSQLDAIKRFMKETLATIPHRQLLFILIVLTRVLQETMAGRHLEEGRILNRSLSERNDFALFHTPLDRRLSLLRLSYGK
jgi:hypothetical protein